ncbi:hypothetical protein DFS34DRAFT_428361 [Phlyctochytrium arcticum]|nr:hypothetical protein DFS34DRAFT_428361 [Phlyctochytrium arcticum]
MGRAQKYYFYSFRFAKGMLYLISCSPRAIKPARHSYSRWMVCDYAFREHKVQLGFMMHVFLRKGLLLWLGSTGNVCLTLFLRDIVRKA